MAPLTHGRHRQGQGPLHVFFVTVALFISRTGSRTATPNLDRLFRDRPESGLFALPTPLYQRMEKQLIQPSVQQLVLVPDRSELSAWSETPVSPLHVPQRQCRYPLPSLALGPTV